MKRLLSIITLSLLTAVAGPSYAHGDSTLSKGSEAMSAGAGFVMLGSMSAIAGSAYVVVTGAAAEGLSNAAGKAITVTATSTGHVLVLSGKALAFIPNEIGKSLLHHSRVGV
jgi:hypothetical protein